MPLAIAIASAGNGTNECRIMSAIEATGARAPGFGDPLDPLDREVEPRHRLLDAAQPEAERDASSHRRMIPRTTRSDCQGQDQDLNAGRSEIEGIASVDGGDAPSEPATNGLPEALRLVRVRSPGVVHERVDVDDEVGRLELRPWKFACQRPSRSMIRRRGSDSHPWSR